jgi:hypothetical protein
MDPHLALTTTSGSSLFQIKTSTKVACKFSNYFNLILALLSNIHDLYPFKHMLFAAESLLNFSGYYNVGAFRHGWKQHSCMILITF